MELDADGFGGGADGEEDVEDEPCLGEGWGRGLALPVEDGGGGSSGTSPWSVVGLSGKLAGLEVGGLGEAKAGIVKLKGGLLGTVGL